MSTTATAPTRSRATSAVSDLDATPLAPTATRDADPTATGELRTVSLSSLRCGQTGTICGIAEQCHESVCHRLRLLGFSSGREVVKVRQAPLGGPMVFRVCDAQMCLRKAQADSIMVRLQPAASADLTA